MWGKLFSEKSNDVLLIPKNFPSMSREVENSRWKLTTFLGLSWGTSQGNRCWKMVAASQLGPSQISRFGTLAYRRCRINESQLISDWVYHMRQICQSPLPSVTHQSPAVHLHSLALSLASCCGNMTNVGNPRPLKIELYIGYTPSNGRCKVIAKRLLHVVAWL
jgi:hypothetical protein